MGINKIRQAGRQAVKSSQWEIHMEILCKNNFSTREREYKRLHNANYDFPSPFQSPVQIAINVAVILRESHV